MRTVGIVGANGFVGTRLVEMFHLGGGAEARPVVRSFKSLARLSRFELDCRIADARDEAALAKALEGCDAVVNTAVGDEKMIEGVIEPVWKACLAAGVRRLVHLSSGSVHGQAPEPGTTEASPLSSQQWNWYNNAKVRAEQRLVELGRGSKLECAILRPTVVFGPRSRWIWDAATAVAEGTACVANGGGGICNSIYVDNLAHAISLAIDAPGAAGEAFLIGDEETVTWSDFYRPIAQWLGVAELPSVEARPEPARKFDLVAGVRSIPGIQAALPRIPASLKRAVKGAWDGWREAPKPSAWRLPEKAAPSLSPEMNALQQCQWRLPHEKAARVLGYQAPVPFAEGMRRSIGWLEFAGFRKGVER